MNIRVLLASALLLASPVAAVAAEHGHHAGHGSGHHATGPVEHSHQDVAAKGLKGTFHFNAPAKAAYTCPMHPEVTSEKAGPCPKCKMALQKQTHHIAVQLFDMKKKPVQGALVRLTIKDSHGMMQGLTMKGNGYYEGAFHLMPGKHTLTAFVKPKGAAEAIAMTVPYEVK